MSFAVLRAVPWWAWAGAALLAALGVQTLRLSDARGDVAREQSARKSDQLRQAEQHIAAVTAAREEEQRRLAAQVEVTRDAERSLSVARADAAAAGDAADRLRRYARDLAARCSAGDPGPAERGAPTDAAGAVLADLLERAESRAGLLAAYADEARIAGDACVRAYESLTITAGPTVQGAE